jgi:beta-glucosidase
LRGDKNRNGRTYWYFDKDVSYEFGYGLSYTTFEYSDITISKKEITPYDQISINVDVKNSGDIDGDEIVQVYLRTENALSKGRPIKQLKGFKRVTIPAGQTQTVSIDINCSDLWFWDERNNKISFDQGIYTFEVGASSLDIKGTVEAVMEGQFKETPETVVAESDKIILVPGETTQTRLSVTLLDDSFIDIEKTNVVYKSNNPSVVKIDQNGLITALQPGLASIFAYVTYNGVTVSDNFPIKIIPDLTPASITVNGTPINGFDPKVKAYSFLIEGKTEIPVVQAESVSNTGLFVAISNARSLCVGSFIISGLSLE